MKISSLLEMDQDEKGASGAKINMKPRSQFSNLTTVAGVHGCGVGSTLRFGKHDTDKTEADAKENEENNEVVQELDEEDEEQDYVDVSRYERERTVPVPLDDPIEDANDEDIDPVKAACLQELFDELQFVHKEMQPFEELFKPASSGYFSNWFNLGGTKPAKVYPEHIYLITPAWWNLWCERVDYKKYERLLK